MFLLSEVVDFRLQYGSLRLFVDQLIITVQVSPDIQYHVACLSTDQAYQHFDYKNCPEIVLPLKPPSLGLRVSLPMI